MNTLQKFIFMGILVVFVSNQLFAEKYRPNGTDTNNGGKPKSNNSVTAGCAPGAGSTYLELNNVRALIHTGGDMWWDLQGTAKYEIPKGSGKTALFAGSIWIGGTDVNGQLKLAAMKFRSNGIDYWPGPLITSGEAQASVTPDICVAYDRHFSIEKSKVAEFRSWFQADAETRVSDFPGYSIPAEIVDWPAHGPSGGYDLYLAPFFDNNNDGSYNSDDGDYPYFDLDNTLPCGTTRELRVPRLYGDQSLWWVYNDRGNLHTETNGDAIGFEIRAQAFAFATNDELNNMTFYNYALINRSTYTLKETYFGVWTDADMGYYNDDYVGCDVNRGLGYLYNGKSVDGTGQPQAYGGPNPPPPAIGIDFFEGPYKDADGEDDLSNWNSNGQIDCYNGYRINRTTGEKNIAGSGDILNGNINGLNFGDSIVDNERWGMRRFIYFNNGACADICDPETAVQHYQYLRGYWKNGIRLVFGGNGYAASGTYTDFMFPGKTDDCNWGTAGNTPPAPTNPLLGWSEKGEGTNSGDRRLVQSAGPFTLEPGAVNDITTGAVWARSASGDEYSSVKLVQKADDKAQKLFENCFKVLDGPDAPELKIIEMNKKLIVHIWNKIGSNNYMEKYSQKDPFIILPDTNPVTNKPYTDIQKIELKKYNFQGYQIFQLANQFVSTDELHNPDKARQVFQCDIKDGVSKLINYTWSDEIGANEPVMEVSGSDEGVKHSLLITEDVFASGDKRLVNNKKYYFVAIAYAYNDYLHYDQTDGNTVLGQKITYKAGRKSASGAIKIYEVIPHINSSENNGTIITSEYGDGVSITQVEGHGNGGNGLELTDETIAEIMSGAPWKSLHQTYKIGKGPIVVKVIDPLNIPGDQYTLKLDTHSISSTEWFNNTSSATYGLIKSANWYIYNSKFDTIWSDQWIVNNDERIIPEWGISINIQQVEYPLQNPHSIIGHYPNEGYAQPLDSFLGPLVNNGVIESSIENSDDTKQWLYFLPDEDGEIPTNWIRSGSAANANAPAYDDYFYNITHPQDPNDVLAIPWDGEQAYEKIVGGGWAPYFLCQKTANSAGPGWDRTMDNFHINVNSGVIETGLSSVEIVITPDKTKWSRSPVIELSADSNLAIGKAQRFMLRRSYSIDKNGNPSTVDVASTNPNDANYIGAKGMGWFPGYAIDTETGERLNIMYGEDSWYPGDNGTDMIWNPSGNIWSFLGEPIFGGKHYIYVMGNPMNFKPKTSDGGITSKEITLPQDPNDTSKIWYLRNYDEGKFIYEYLTKYPYYYPTTTSNVYQLKPGARKIMSTAMWVSIPLTTGTPLENKTVPLSEIKIKIKLAKPYQKGYKAYALDSALTQNNNFPMYTFSTSGNKTITGDIETAKNALDLIGVVPNPYYGYNAYEATQTDNLVKLINLPRRCTVTIYTVSGTLVRKFDKDSESTIIEWDLKNNYGISISSGLYIIHVNTPGVGEKIVKWFGAMRPIDLNAF